ncbi:RING-H2 finger protein ATL33-like [Malania oleifera]|uniref:RING-H2 finger protein ATL33-like n=1 Tax=Malania oleifera TaxID=397392 RepID=UPI0025AE6064|nr:RING-H2 finger protein ATL33-like [Malania oleifera]
MQKYTPPPAALNLRAPPPSAAHSHTFEASLFCYIIAPIAFFSIPALIYAFFITQRCPLNPNRRSTTASARPWGAAAAAGGEVLDDMELKSPIKYQDETHVGEYGDECPVCLSPYADGERIRRLSSCKHSFHASCIDKWLYSHSNCPVCRVPVAVKCRGSAVPVAGDNHMPTGWPDASSLV